MIFKNSKQFFDKLEELQVLEAGDKIVSLRVEGLSIEQDTFSVFERGEHYIKFVKDDTGVLYTPEEIWNNRTSEGIYKVPSGRYVCENCGDSSDYVDEMTFFDSNGNERQPEEKEAANPDACCTTLCNHCYYHLEIPVPVK